MSTKFQESESDISAGESSVEGGTSPSIPPQPPPRSHPKKKRSGHENWEVLEGLKEGQTYDRIPKKFEGFVLKKRKWPLKGYHKRYFILENGMISYGKTGWDMARGKVHGSLDAGMSVISTKPRDGRIDIDSEDCIYHLKIKPKEVYMEWLEKFNQHRLYRQHILSIKGTPIQPVKEVSIDRELNLVEKDISNLQTILDNIKQNDNKNDRMRDFVIVAKDVTVSLRGIVRAVSSVKDNEGLATLKHTLNVALQQNADFKSKLARIQREASFQDIYPVIQSSDTIKSFSSNSEYYDAITSVDNEDRTSSDEESLSEDCESINSESSEQLVKYDDLNSLSSSAPPSATLQQSRTLPKFPGTRRSVLPCPQPSDPPSLWGILKKNIGKDLSRVSMPVGLNEPLGVLQRMCEELEYSELLDQASKETDPIERMALIAAFTVSTYANAALRTHKPFNPLLGETYECIRDDKGFKFIAEQVSHHPPISACFSEGKEWQFWQDTHVKSKFWGKSMEIQPIGNSCIILVPYSESYSYNKATSCVHNLFNSASRWVDLYGTVLIQSRNLKCTLTYTRASYWNNQKYDVQGTITKDGVTVRNLYGRWNESFHSGQPPSAKCLWRMGSLPEDYANFYGFTRFAIELNEPTDGVPITDTRRRPDQRLLEEGNLVGAESMKMTLEQNQRERRKKQEEMGVEHQPKWFRKDTNGNSWEFNGKYWDEKKGGFKNTQADPLWP